MRSASCELTGTRLGYTAIFCGRGGGVGQAGGWSR